MFKLFSCFSEIAFKGGCVIKQLLGIVNKRLNSAATLLTHRCLGNSMTLSLLRLNLALDTWLPFPNALQRRARLCEAAG